MPGLSPSGPWSMPSLAVCFDSETVFSCVSVAEAVGAVVGRDSVDFCPAGVLVCSVLSTVSAGTVSSVSCVSVVSS